MASLRARARIRQTPVVWNTRSPRQGNTATLAAYLVGGASPSPNVAGTLILTGDRLEVKGGGGNNRITVDPNLSLVIATGELELGASSGGADPIIAGGVTLSGREVSRMDVFPVMERGVCVLVR